MALDVLMVTPPSRLEVYQELSKKHAALEPPVWSGLIADYIRRNGFVVDMLDAEAECLTHEQAARRISDADPRLIVYMVYGQQPSASTQCMPAGGRTARRVQELTDRPSIVVGTHASALPERTLREEPYTFVCQGEGPLTVRGLINHIRYGTNLSEVPGLAYRDGDNIRLNGFGPLIDDLDNELPEQAWDLLDMSKYRAHNWHTVLGGNPDHGYASVQTSLGCPYKCSFCCINAPFGKAGIRYWDPETIIKQIDELVERYNVKTIKIPDELFVLNKSHVNGICDRLIERNYDLNFWAYARIDTLRPEFMSKLQKAGIQWLGIGIESASKYVRDGMTKGKFGNTDIENVISLCRDAGLYTSANYIFGLPDDTQESMQETLDLALHLNTEWANFYSSMSYPGSPLYRLAVEQRWPLPDSKDSPGWIGYSQHAYETLPLPTNTMSGIEVLDFRDEAFHEYFTNPDYLAMITGKFGSDAAAHMQDMTKIRLKRRHHDDPGYYKKLAEQVQVLDLPA